MIFDNEVSISMSSQSQNEAFARIVAAAFIAPLDPLLNELTDIKTAVSEAVTNSIIHGYESREGVVRLRFQRKGNTVTIRVEDEGVGIENIEQAMTAPYTSKPELERSGMGFTVMQTFMDEVEVTSSPGEGTCVVMSKTLTLKENAPDISKMVGAQ